MDARTDAACANTVAARTSAAIVRHTGTRKGALPLLRPAWLQDSVLAPAPDLVGAIPSVDAPRLQTIKADIDFHQAKIKRAQNDYDNELIEDHNLSRVRKVALAKIDALEKERRSLMIATDLGGVLDAKNPVKEFDDADLMIKRRVIDFFMTVKLHPHPRGKKTFDPATVEIAPRTVPGVTAHSN